LLILNWEEKEKREVKREKEEKKTYRQKRMFAR
jgi:hypothetical protein